MTDTVLDVVMADRHRLKREAVKLKKEIKQLLKEQKIWRAIPVYHLCNGVTWLPWHSASCSSCKTYSESSENVLDALNRLQKYFKSEPTKE